MGSSTSKGARAAGSAARKYPSRASNPTTNAPSAAPPAGQASRPGPTVRPAPQATTSRTEAVDLDARDPTLAAHLRTLGAVQPNPHYSPTSRSPLDPQRNTSTTQSSDASPFANVFPDPRANPAVALLEARRRIQEEAEREVEQVGRRGFAGREYIDAGILRQAVARLQRGESQARVEKDLEIRPGRLSALGKGVVESV